MIYCKHVREKLENYKSTAEMMPPPMNVVVTAKFIECLLDDFSEACDCDSESQKKTKE